MWDSVLSRSFYSEFQDRKIIVAGGSSGIGAAIADGFHWLGANVTVLDKNPPASPISGIQYLSADLADEAGRKKAVDELCQGEMPYAMVSTIGLDRRVHLASHEQQEMENLLRVNFIAPIMLARDLIEPIRKGGGGAICLFTSHHGSDLCETDMMGYGAAKAALDNGIRRLAKFAGEDNRPDSSVRVFGLRPGWVMTENQAARFAEEEFKHAVQKQLIPVPMMAADLVPFVIANLSQRNAGLLSGTILNYDAGNV